MLWHCVLNFKDFWKEIYEAKSICDSKKLVKAFHENWKQLLLVRFSGTKTPKRGRVVIARFRA